MNVSIKQLIKEVRELSLAHGQVKSFHYGDTLNLLKRGAIDYTTVLMNVSTSPMGRDLTNLNIEILVMDRVLKGDDKGKLDVENTTHGIIRHLLNVIGYSTRWRVFSELKVDAPVQKYYDHFADEVTGWGASITLQTYNAYGICDLPIFDYDYDQTIPEEECDVLVFVRNSNNDVLVTKIVSDSDNFINIPDITVTDSDGTTYNSPSGVDVVCTAGGGTAIITNSNGTYNNTVDGGDTLVLADVNNVDSDGTIVPTPAMMPFVCDTIDNLVLALHYDDNMDSVDVLGTVANVGTYDASVGYNYGSIEVSTDAFNFIPLAFPFSITLGVTYSFRRSNVVDFNIFYIFRTTSNVLDYYGSYSSGISRRNLLLYLNSSDVNSYSGSGSLWNDISGNGHTFDLINSPAFDPSFGGLINFNGIDQRASANPNDFTIEESKSYTIWIVFKIDVGSTVKIPSLATFKTNQALSMLIPYWTYTSDFGLGIWATGSAASNTQVVIRETIDYGKFHLLEVKYNALGFGNPSSFSMKVNSIPKTLYNGSNGLARPSNTTVIGSNAGSTLALFPFKGVEPQIVVWEGDLTPTEEANNYTFLDNIYNFGA